MSRNVALQQIHAWLTCHLGMCVGSAWADRDLDLLWMGFGANCRIFGSRSKIG